MFRMNHDAEKMRWPAPSGVEPKTQASEMWPVLKERAERGRR